MKTFTIIITGDTPDAESHASILEAAARAERSIADGTFLVTNIATNVDVVFDHRTEREMTLDDLAREIARSFFPDRKIEAIKELRAKGAGLGLKEAKDLIDKHWDDLRPF